MPNNEELLKVENLSIDIYSEKLRFSVIDNVSFEVQKKEVHAVVGESGCGKTITSLAITKLLPKEVFFYNSGKILFKNQDVLQFTPSKLKDVRGKEISYIFQDPFTSLNPLKKIKDQIIEGYLLHVSKNQKEAIDKAKFLLTKVGLTDLDSRLNSYPNQMSGGMLQRISIAMSLMCDPALLIADEPTSAIDVTIQAQLIELLQNLKVEMGMSILFISHDIGLVASIADKISIMYAGKLVETGKTDEVIVNPSHPYTEALIQSVPSMRHELKRLKTIEGIVPSPLNYPKGCRFSTRCEKKIPICLEKVPEKIKISDTHFVECFMAGKNA
ncbi:MAG: ABC transporter ATP-binding protein [Leptospiraceae bacterium]|nr:ABC transporter ATP-binding protein [Leptospiraceae bacterium]MCK6382531.1 ABC transporter ATP-binding protein [Leptospiraceae bacterium]NUM42076.1 ABC transporter ATP-binding protein [Leptospiraceae bacterium]